MVKMNPNSVYLTMALAILACALLFAVCWLPYTTVLNKNPCDMTFTNKGLDDRSKIIPLKSNQTSYKLWRYVNDYESDWLDEPQPVLFIPGHQGSADQVRSLASDIMHNKDGPFQYFSIDFGTKWSSSSAIHANNVVSQAIFVNEALAHIQSRYINKQKKSSRGKKTTIDGRTGGGNPPQIALVAHSAGGIVARLAVLLSNHPSRKLKGVNSTFPLVADPVSVKESTSSANSSCLVSTMVLISSPISKPEFCLDVSLSKLFTSVNQAWLSSYFHTSKQCLNANLKRARASLSATRTASAEANSDSFAGIDIDWVCPRCVANIQVVSVTGGLLDRMVSPLSTHVSVITPQPTAATVEDKPAEVAKGETMISLLVAPHKLVWYLAKALFAQLLSVPGRIAGMITTPSNQTESLAAAAINGSGTGVSVPAAEGGAADCVATVEMDVDGNEAEVSTGISCNSAEDKVDSEFSTASAKPAAATMDANTTSAAEKDEAGPELLEYIEPQHLSLWASQLMFSGDDRESYLGHPVDHAAQLWCFQLLNSLHEGLVEVVMANQGRRHGVNMESGGAVEAASASSTRNMAAYFNIFVQQENITSPYVPEHFPAGQRGAHAARTRMYTALWRDGFTQDMEYLHDVLSMHMPLPALASLYVLGATYFTKHCIAATLFCFVVISLSVFIVPIFRNICGIATTSRGVGAKQGPVNHGTLFLLRPWVHFQLDVLAPALYHLLYPHEGDKGGKGKGNKSTTPATSPAPGERVALASVWVNRWVGIIILLLGLRAVYHFQTMSLGKLVAAYEHPFKWFVSYGVAMVLYYALSLALNIVRVVISGLLLTPLELVFDWLVCRPVGFVGRLLLFNTIWKVKKVRVFLKKNFGIRRKEKKAPVKRVVEDPAAEAARRRAGLPKSTGSIFESEEEEEDKTLAAADAAGAASPSLLRVAWVMAGPILRSCTSLGAFVVLALLQVDESGELVLSTQPLWSLTTGHFTLSVASLWLSVLLVENYCRVLFGRREGGSGDESSFVARVAAMRLDTHESQLLVLYSVVIVIMTPHALQSAELLFGSSTPAQSAKSPQLLYWLIARAGLDASRPNPVLDVVLTGSRLLMDILDSNRVYKTMALVNTGHAVYGPERVYDLCCLVLANMHLLALLYWRKMANALNEYGFVGQSEDRISNVALPWCVSSFGLDHPNFSPRALLAGGSVSDKLKDPAHMFTSGAFGSGSSSNNSACCHEDGGKYAVFEEVKGDDAVSALPSGSGRSGISSSLHTTRFKVIFCACSRDKSLTNGVVDYCEYCRCYKCGGKNLPREDADSSDPAAQAKTALRNLWNTYFNAELMLLLLCVAVVVWLGRNYAASDGVQTNFFIYGRVIAAFSAVFMLYLLVRTYSAKLAALFEKF